MKQLLQKYSEAYYDGNPIISNEEYDALERVHGQVLQGTGDVAHRFRMYSLQKHYDKDGAYPFNGGVQTPKLDGAAVSLLYVEGKLVLGLSRGNGIVGRDITEKLAKLVPGDLVKDLTVQVTGEVVALENVENSRNFASGALNLKDLKDFDLRVADGKMKFVAYNVQEVDDSFGIEDTYEKDMNFLASLGFETILDGDFEGYPKDGIVFRKSRNAEFNSLGFTDKFPRGAFAHKEEQESVETTLLDVVWETGKSGKVTPVAILETVVIDEANVSRATLNNEAYIEALDLEIGCTVQVIRAGEIIPKIIGRVYD